jgi:PilZ domain
MGAIPERSERLSPVAPLGLEAETTRVSSFSGKPGPRRFARVPTHAVGVARENRRYPRAKLSLPMRLISVGGIRESFAVTMVTRNISSSGIYFLAPRQLEVGAAIDLEIALVDRPIGQGRVQMFTAAHVVRAEATQTPGWWGYAATFDDFALEHDDVIPLRFSA